MRDGSLTRKKLERCALTLFVEKGVSATTIKDIANKAQVAEGTLYRHYESKDELAQHLFTSAYETFTKEITKLAIQQPSLAAKMEVMVRFFCKCYDDDPILFNYLLLVQHTQVKVSHGKDINAHENIVMIFNDAIKKKEIAKKDPNIYASIVLGIVLQAALSRVYKRITRTMLQDADELVAAIAGALGY
ncbi:MAG: TetR/AcrR family transcriptional regulator [Candidatus Berkiella sp.]